MSNLPSFNRRLLSTLVTAFCCSLPVASFAWTLGFESSEGFDPGKLKGRSKVALLGGSASIESDGAAEGEQYLRFIPKREENALVLDFGEEGGDGAAAIEFSLRLHGEGEETRLVLSYGQTLSIRSVEGGIEIDPNHNAQSAVRIEAASSTWLPIGIYEKEKGTGWDLYIDDTLVVEGLPRETADAALKTLLVFSDGALDLDAVVVLGRGADSGSDVSVDKGRGNKPESPPGQDGKPKRKSRDGTYLGKAISNASQGKSVAALRILTEAISAEIGDDYRDGRLGLDLAIVAFNLLENARRDEARLLAWQALEHLADAAIDENETAMDRSGYRFLAGQIHERIFADFVQAEEHYMSAEKIDPNNTRASKSASRARRKAGGDLSDDVNIPGGKS